jgi:hypothetical protein
MAAADADSVLPSALAPPALAAPLGIAAQQTSAAAVIERASMSQTPAIRLKFTDLVFPPLSPDAD